MPSIFPPFPGRPAPRGAHLPRSSRGHQRHQAPPGQRSHRARARHAHERPKPGAAGGSSPGFLGGFHTSGGVPKMLGLRKSHIYIYIEWMISGGTCISGNHDFYRFSYVCRSCFRIFMWISSEITNQLVERESEKSSHSSVPRLQRWIVSRNSRQMPDGSSALFAAAAMNKLTVVKYLLAAGADKDCTKLVDFTRDLHRKSELENHHLS